MKLPDIIGIAGTNGSGKDTLADLREKLEEVLHIGLGDMLRIEARKRGLELSRANLGSISTEWEQQLGAGALVQKVMEYYQQERGGKGGLIISSVRRVSEAEAIKRLGGIIIWVDADRRARYDRIRNSRGRVDDMISFEEFCAQEDAELYDKTGTKGAMNAANIKDIADIKIENNFDSKEQYEAYLRDTFEL